MMIHRKTLRRPGYSLIEMLTVLGGFMAILAVCMGMMHQLMKLDRGQRDHTVSARQQFELTRALRDDIHRGTGSPDVQEATLKLSLTDGSDVEYRPDGAALLRTQTAKGLSTRRERFALAAGTAGRFEKSERSGRVWIRYETVAAKKGELSPSGVVAPVEAILGRDALREKE